MTTTVREPLQAANEGMPRTETEEEKCSSYGTGESAEEAFADNQQNQRPGAIVDRLEDMKCNIEGIDA